MWRGGLCGIVLLLAAPAAEGQGVMQRLGIQGIEQHALMSVRARGMGGVFAALPGEVESVVLNPAGLAIMQRPAVAASGFWRSGDWAETQHWNPNRYYAGLSLYFADPDAYTTDPFANPDWTHRQRTVQLGALGGAMPFRLAGRRVAVGLMLHQAAHLGDYDRNDNVLDPYIGQFRPAPIERPNPGEEIEVRWSAFERERVGHLRAISMAAGMEVAQNLYVGLRVARSWGTTTDRQQLRDRGLFLLREDAHDYSFDTADGYTAWEGTSEFSGMSATVGLHWQYHVLRTGIVFTFPHTVAHSFSYARSAQASVSGDTNVPMAGDDEVTLPARIVLGAAVRPMPRVMIAVDYFRQDYALLKSSGAAPDWDLAHGIGLGIEGSLRDDTWIRAGFRRDPRGFRIEGSGLLGETATGDALSAGIGHRLGVLVLDMSYEFQRLLYQDRWESNVDFNRIRKHNVLFGATYSF